LNFPSTHVVHADEFAAATCVALHGTQSSLEVAPGCGEAVSAGHAVLTWLPAGRLVYAPAAHDTHWASVVRLSNPCVVFPAAHSWHVLARGAATAPENVPLAHGTHAASPLPSL